jgi:flagellar hook-associated protein 1 FlgK
MGGLFSTLNSSLDALRAFQNALDVSQNNVSNASTPGYSSQVASFTADPFEPGTGLTGGVQSNAPQSTDNQYADQAVRSEYEAQGNYTAQSTPLQSIEGLFDVTGQTGVTGALNQLFQSFSSWSAEPNSPGSAQAVLNSAQNVAQSFQSAATALSQTTQSVNQQITSTVQQINTLATSIQKDNIQIQQEAQPDAGLQANLQANLDSLSQLTDTTVTFAQDGTATVLMGGQTPLVMGAQQFNVQASFTDPSPGPNPDATQDAHILDSNGQDITSEISQGSLGGLLYVRNTVLPGLQGNGSQAGSLNQLAQQVADSVNQVLAASQTTGGQPGTPLFAYSNSSPVDVAATLTLDPNITAAGLAPVDPGPPAVANGAALTLAGLGDSTATPDQVDGQTINQFMGSIAAQVGQQASDASTGQTLHTQLLAQAQSLQSQISGVSLDAEAVKVLELQQGYDAAGKMVTVISQLATTLIDMGTATA